MTAANTWAYDSPVARAEQANRYHAPLFSLIDQYVDHYAATTPKAIAAVSGNTEITYAQLARQVCALAAQFVRAGAGHGQVVAVFGDSRPEAYVALLAAARIGSIYLGLSPRSSIGDCEHQLADADPVLILDLGAQRRQLAEILPPGRRDLNVLDGRPTAGTQVRDFEAFPIVAGAVDAADVDAARTAVVADDGAVLVYTSGTTGAAKGALLSHRATLTGAYLTERTWFPIAVPSFVLDWPINHNAWVVCAALPALVGGGKIVFRESSDATETLRAIERHQLNSFLCFPPQLIDAVESTAFQTADLSSLRHLNVAVAVAPDLITRFRTRAPDAWPFTGYGCGEASGGTVLCTTVETPLETASVTCGTPIPEVEVKLVAGDAGEEATRGGPGELWIRGPLVFSGYLNRPEATAEALDDDGWLHTGDVLQVGDDGNWRIVGRQKEMFKSGGYNVYPTEIERVLAGHPDVIEVAVVATPHPRWAEVGVAFVLVDTQSKANVDATVEAIEAYARKELAVYKVPKRFVICDEFPRLPNGKIDRVELRRRGSTTNVEASA